MTLLTPTPSASVSQSRSPEPSHLVDRAAPLLLPLALLQPRTLRYLALTDNGAVIVRPGVTLPRSALTLAPAPASTALQSLSPPIACPLTSATPPPIARFTLQQKANLKAAYYWLNQYDPGPNAPRFQQLEASLHAYHQLIEAGAWSLVTELLGELRSPLVRSIAITAQAASSRKRSLLLPRDRRASIADPSPEQQHITHPNPEKQPLPASSWHEQLGELGLYLEQVQVYKKALDGPHWQPEQRLSLLLKLGRSYIGLGQMKKAEEYGQKALKLAQKLGDLAQEAEAHSLMGQVMMRRSSLLQFRIYFRRQLHLAQRLQSPLLLAQAWADWANIQLHYNPRRATRSYRKAAQQFTKIPGFANIQGLEVARTVKAPNYTDLAHQPSWLQTLYYQIQTDLAANFLHTNQYQGIIPHLQALLAQIQANQSFDLQYLLRYTLGNIYTCQQNWDQAQSIYEELLAFTQERHYGKLEVCVGNSLAVLHCYSLKNYRKSIDIWENMVKKAEFLGFESYRVIMYSHLAHAHRFSGNLTQAQHYHQQAQDLYPQIQDRSSKALILSGFAHWHWQEKQFLRCFWSLAHCFWLVPPWRSANGQLIMRKAREVIGTGIRQGLARLGCSIRLVLSPRQRSQGD